MRTSFTVYAYNPYSQPQNTIVSIPYYYTVPKVTDFKGNPMKFQVLCSNLLKKLISFIKWSEKSNKKRVLREFPLVVLR